MPEGLLSVVGLLAAGYLLLFVEIFAPGAVLGIVGLGTIGYGCYEAFRLGPLWGTAALVMSGFVTTLALGIILKSRSSRAVALDLEQSKTWKASPVELRELLGETGRTLSVLRPAGLVEIAGRRIDVVADCEFLPAGIKVRVCEVEGGRIRVEALADEKAPEMAPEPGESTGEPSVNAEHGGP